MQYRINRGFEKFEPFINRIQTYFRESDNSIHKARNELKIIDYQDVKTVVKSFKIPHLINRIVYTFFKDSKAKKSYEYSIKISKFTPRPIGYIEFFSMGLLQNSYFISEQFDYDFTIREPLLDNNFQNKNSILRAFANFTFDLHENKIFHQDYSPGNILVKKDGDEYIFKIVDINRMKFIRLDLDGRLKNFSKLWMKDEDLKVVAKEYAIIMKVNESSSIQKALYYSQKHKNKINMKKRLKGIEVVD